MPEETAQRFHDGRFQKRVALVTGAGSGIGRTTARSLVQEGACVGFLGRTARKLEEASSGLPPERTLLLPASHEVESEVESAVEQVVSRFGALDIVVNNAGEYTQGSTAETGLEEWKRSLDVNLTGPFLVSRVALPHLRKSSGGVIINVASTLGLKPIPGALSYCVAKAGLVMLTRATAIEEAANGVRALAVCPGVVDTPIHANRAEVGPDNVAALLDEMARFHPLGRVGETKDVAALILYLASDVSSWNTGAVVPIDGGISLA